MNTLILNRETFEMPESGWYQIAPLGEFPHSPSGVVQVVDAAACVSMVNRFGEESRVENFAGLLIDFDHFSLDEKNKSEAAGWITELEHRPASPEGYAATNSSPGLWGRIRWSDLGEDAVKGGRYRFLSPVWTRADCEDLGNRRVRPVRLLNAAVTNDPNLKGMVPLSNRSQESAVRSQNGIEPRMNTDGRGCLANGQQEPRYKWTLGNSLDGRHCPSCAALSGQVHTMAEWTAAGLTPGAGGLYCGGNCHCSLVETGDPADGDLDGAPVSEPEPVDPPTPGGSGATGNRDASSWLRQAKETLRNRGTSDGDDRQIGSANDVVALEKRRRRVAACLDR